MFWRLHQSIFSDQIVNAYNFLNDIGDQVQIVTGASLLTEPVTPIYSQPALAITTLQDARKISGHFSGRCTPWLFFNEIDYSVSTWMPNLISSIPVLNRDSFFVPYSSLKYLSPQVLKAISGTNEKIFMKPDKGHKSFPGQSFSLDSFHQQIQNELGHLRLDPELMCFLAPHQPLHEIEWRFWIVQRDVVAYSPYSWDQDIAWSTAPSMALSLAKQVADNPWQPDHAYVVDLVQASSRWYVNEINAASTSGIYSAPIDDLLSSLRLVAHDEFYGDLTL